MKGLRDILGESKSVSRFGREVKIGGIIAAHWRAVFGQLASTLQYSHLKEGVVYIVAENPVWRTEIDRYKTGFLDKINLHLKRERYQVRNIVLKVGNVSGGSRPIIGDEAKTHSQQLDDKIRKEVRRRQKLGYQLCTECGKVWDTDSVCTLCRVSN
ncbi:MAG: DciA family protein [bacterium]|nr:DciA family protein [bacterium]